MKTIIFAAVLFLLISCNGAGTDQPSTSDTGATTVSPGTFSDSMGSSGKDSANRYEYSDTTNSNNNRMTESNRRMIDSNRKRPDTAKRN